MLVYRSVSRLVSFCWWEVGMSSFRGLKTYAKTISFNNPGCSRKGNIRTCSNILHPWKKKHDIGTSLFSIGNTSWNPGVSIFHLRFSGGISYPKNPEAFQNCTYTPLRHTGLKGQKFDPPKGQVLKSPSHQYWLPIEYWLPFNLTAGTWKIRVFFCPGSLEISIGNHHF